MTELLNSKRRCGIYFYTKKSLKEKVKELRIFGRSNSEDLVLKFWETEALWTGQIFNEDVGKRRRTTVKA